MSEAVQQALMDEDAIIEMSITTYQDGSLEWGIEHNPEILPDGPNLQYIHTVFNELMKALIQNEQQAMMSEAYGNIDVTDEDEEEE